MLKDCYKTDDPSEKLECVLKNILTQTCRNENTELLKCIKGTSKRDQVKKCYPEVVKSQRCFDIEMYNLLLVAKGMN